MKKLLLVIAIAALSTTAQAEEYQPKKVDGPSQKSIDAMAKIFGQAKDAGKKHLESSTKKAKSFIEKSESSRKDKD